MYTPLTSHEKDRISAFMTGVVEELKVVDDFYWLGKFPEQVAELTPEALRFEWDRMRPNRKMGGFSRIGDPGHKGQKEKWDTLAAEPLRFRWVVELTGAEATYLRAPGTAKQPLGKSRIMKRLADAKLMGQRLYNYACGLAVIHGGGTVHLVDGSAVTFDIGLPEAQSVAKVTDLDPTFTSWATASTRIKPQLDAARKVCRLQYNVDCRRVLMNEATFRDCLLPNAEYKEWAKENPDLAREAAQTGVFKRFLGYTIEPRDDWYDANPEGEEESMVNLIPDDHVVLLPENETTEMDLALLTAVAEDLEAPKDKPGWYAKMGDPQFDPSVIQALVNYVGVPVARRPCQFIFRNVQAV